jgi:molybdopterin molybdotransferase
MISVKEASVLIQKATQKFSDETVNFLESQDRVLKEAILADTDFPPFDRVCMDGIAISKKQFDAGKRSFAIEGVQAAGSPQKTLKNSESCLEVMTGAILPKNTDVVIPYELITIENGNATVNLDEVKELQNIHLQGRDRAKGEIVIEKNTTVTPAEIGVLATVGKAKVKVIGLPKILIVSTGNELVEVTETPLTHQIRRSNVYSLVSLLKRLSIKADARHLTDDKENLKRQIQTYLETYDVLIFSGAVSKGKFDFLPEVLEELGVEKLFHKVKQRPGKPFWFGQRVALDVGGVENKTTIFAFPGNPVSTYVNCLKYFYPWHQKSLGIKPSKEMAVLGVDFSFKPSMTYFLQVKLANKAGVLVAIPQIGNGSGDLTNLVDADAFLELPADKTEFKKGEFYPILRYRTF